MNRINMGKRGIVHAQSPFYLIILAAFFLFFLVVALFISPDQEEINQNFYTLRLDSITREFNSAFNNGSTNYDLINSILFSEYQKVRKQEFSNFNSDLNEIQSIVQEYFDQFEYFEYDLVLEVNGFGGVKLICYQKGTDACLYQGSEFLVRKGFDHTTTISYYVPDGSILRELKVNYNYIAR